MRTGSKFSITKRNLIKKRDQIKIRQHHNHCCVSGTGRDLSPSGDASVVVAIEWILFVLPTYCNSPYHIVIDIMTMPVLQFVILFMDWLPLLSVLIIMKKVNPVLSRDRAKCSKCIYLELYFVSYGWNHAI